MHRCSSIQQVALVGLTVAQTPRFAQPRKGSESSSKDAAENVHDEPIVTPSALHDGGNETSAESTKSDRAAGHDEESVQISDKDDDESTQDSFPLDWASAGIALATGLAAASQGM